jgi:hypothetical protein
MTPDEYRQAIGELARGATMPDDVAAKIEARLERSFEESREETPALRLRRPSLRRRRVSFTAVAAAAAVVVAVGAGAWYAWRQPITSNNVTSALPAPGRPGLTARTADQAGVTALATATASLPDRGPRRKVGRSSARRLPPVIRPQGFVAVPAAAGLPRFESGVIVRMSLPVTALPSFGVDISPASGDQPVEADVLVGQDGLARAIRLVNTSRSQQ